nr:(2Fe-2S)-binding protein [Limnobaculum zhutongyuii]
MKFILNGKPVTFDGEPDTPLLWVLREDQQLTGTKFGCGVGACGACTVHVDGEAVRSCCYPLLLVEGRSVTTIEGLSPDRSHPVQKAWIKEEVPQCGYCQSGMIMAVSAVMARKPLPLNLKCIKRSPISVVVQPITAFAWPFIGCIGNKENNHDTVTSSFFTKCSNRLTGYSSDARSQSGINL